jgi:hypothetical protein
LEDGAAPGYIASNWKVDQAWFETCLKVGLYKQNGPELGFGGSPAYVHTVVLCYNLLK